MADRMEEGSAIRQRLSALRFWIYNFPQLEEYHQRVVSNDSDELCNHAEFDDDEIVCKIIEIAEEICDCEISFPRPTSASQSWAAIHCLARDNGLAIDDFDAYLRQDPFLKQPQGLGYNPGSTRNARFTIEVA